MHRLLASKQREFLELSERITFMKQQLEDFRKEKEIVEFELEVLREEKIIIQEQVEVKRKELANLLCQTEESQQQSSESGHSYDAHRAFLCNSSSSFTESISEQVECNLGQILGRNCYVFFTE